MAEARGETARFGKTAVAPAAQEVTTAMTTTTTPIPCPAAPTKLGRVATIGYHQLQAWQIMTRIVYEHGWYLVDIRSDRRSYLDEWSAASLRRHFRYSYHAAPELGILQTQHPDRPVQSVQLADPATGLEKITTWLEAGYNCLLLCACPDWQCCHRKQVAQLLQQVYPPLEVIHLVHDACVVDLPLLPARRRQPWTNTNGTPRQQHYEKGTHGHD